MARCGGVAGVYRETVDVRGGGGGEVIPVATGRGRSFGAAARICRALDNGTSRARTACPKRNERLVRLGGRRNPNRRHDTANCTPMAERIQ